MNDFATTGASSFATSKRPNGLGSLFGKSGCDWLTFSKVASFAQIVLGAVIFLCSSSYLMNGGRSSGQLIGVVSAVLGVVSLLGIRFKQAPLEMLFVVGMGFAAVMTFEFTVQVGRDVDTHCSFAEVYTRLEHMEERMLEMRHDEMAMQLFERLNEVDDMLDMVQQGNLDEFEMASKSNNLMEKDAQYIGSKIHMLRFHAERVLEQLEEEENKARAAVEGATDPAAKRKHVESQTAVRKRLENVIKVLEALDEKEKQDDGYTYEEYESLFQALLGNHQKSEILQKEKTHMPFLKEAWERYSKGYKGEAGDKVGGDLALQKHRAEQREMFEDTFHQTMDDHHRTGPPAFHQTLAQSLDDLPEHCLLENEHLMYFVWGGWLLILAQVTSAYVTATTLAMTSLKKDY